MNLNGKTAVVTGAASGIGKATAFELARAASAGAFQRNPPAVRVVLAAAVGAPAGAGAQLRSVQRIGGSIVGLDPDDHAVPDMDLQEAAPAAIVARATCADDADGSGLALRQANARRVRGQGNAVDRQRRGERRPD